MLGKVKALCISPVAGAPMQVVSEVEAIAGIGFKGDRYALGEGSFNRKTGVGNRQVTLINHIFFDDSDFEYHESRRNIVTNGVELMWLIGREFQIGATARFRGVKYCDPCLRPSELAGKERSFSEAFFDRGGIVAEVLEGGLIRVDDIIVPPDKSY